MAEEIDEKKLYRQMLVDMMDRAQCEVTQSDELFQQMRVAYNIASTPEARAAHVTELVDTYGSIMYASAIVASIGQRIDAFDKATSRIIRPTNGRG